MYEYALEFLHQYVEIYTFLSKEKLYGTIIKVTPLELVLHREYIEKASNKNYDIYLPLSSVISINKLS
ncbi:MAG: ATPase [Romboutsia sp.]|uniref:ATPase n=1 Tax=Romboutsia sp. TaxID=1965302 RepID=UPI003F33B883